jgi:hypothetical protein
MASAHEFYDYADEHFGWGGTAKTERERAILLQMDQRVFGYNVCLLFGGGRLFGRPEHLLKATNPTL